MKNSTVAILSLALLSLIMAGGCGKENNQPTSPQGSSGDATALYPLTFYHIEDSDGTKPADGVDMALLFEPNGIADLYVARETEAVARKGSYTFKDGAIALKFTDDDFKHDVSFTLDTAQGTVTMPFKAFSEGSGSSTWRRERNPVEENMSIIFNSATLAENLPSDRAIDRVTTYANAMMAIDALGKPAYGKGSFGDPPKLTGVKPYLNGIELEYDKGPYVDVQLYGWSMSHGQSLTLSPLASDPRVHLDPEPPHNGAFDPDEKSALFFAPFDDDRENVFWYDYDFFNRVLS